MDKILEMLDEEILRLTDELSSLQPGTEGYANVETDLCNLLDRREKLVSTEYAHYDKMDELDTRKKDRLIGMAFDGVKAIGAAGIAIWMTVKGFQFEETGVFRSNTFKEGRSNMFRSIFRK